MSSGLPYVNSTGALKQLLQKIKDAATPDRFNYDYLSTELGVSERAMIPLLKKLGFLGEDGKPTQLYRDFRNPDHSGAAMAEGLKKAYDSIYKRNEYAHSLSRDKIIKIIADLTGKDHDVKSVKTTYTTFDTLRSHASFDSKLSQVKKTEPVSDSPSPQSEVPEYPMGPQNRNVGLNLGYTVNLNLPETTNIEVYNAIFKSLNEHFLKYE